MTGAVREGATPNLTAIRDAPLGGQAVVEGVMMRGVRYWAVAVRKPAVSADGSADWSAVDALGPVVVREFELAGLGSPGIVSQLPLVRGVVALAGSLRIGVRALGIAAGVALGEEDEEPSGWLWVSTLILAFAFAVGLFFVVPVTVVSLFRHQIGSAVLFWLVEGLLRTAIFLLYLGLIARLPDLRRTLQYHGAEHKVISCYEAGDALVPERAALYSRLHPRCGTSFLLLVMIVSIFVFAAAGLHSWWVLVLTRIVGVPIVAGIAFELIRWAGRNRRRRWVQLVMAPGMALQRLTTREPALDQLQVAIAALNAVLAHEPGADASPEALLGAEVLA